MDNYKTKLAEEIIKKEGGLEGILKKYIIDYVEKVLNDTMENELTSYLNYDKYHKNGIAKEDYRNGYYNRELTSTLGKLNLKVPRDRNGEFNTEIIPPYKRKTDEFIQFITMLYSMNASDRDIEKFTLSYFKNKISKSCISDLTDSLIENVNDFKNRKLKKKYLAIFMDATFLPIRRDTVSKDAVIIALGIKEDGTKEIVSFLIVPNENLDGYNTILKDIKNRGVEEVNLFVTDGFIGLHDTIINHFPKAEHQQCFVHFERNIINNVRKKDRAEIILDLKKLLDYGGYNDALFRFGSFVKKWSRIYPKLKLDEFDPTYLFTFIKYPLSLRRYIYTNNILEGFNKNIKRLTKAKIQFPNEQSLEKVLVTIFVNYENSKGTRRFSNTELFEDKKII